MHEHDTLGVDRRHLLSGLSAAALTGFLGHIFSNPARALETKHVRVWKSNTCSCCEGWVSYMRARGYEITVTTMDDVAQIKSELGIPADLSSCHTAQIDGYLVEGHVPESAVLKLLTERPELRGISLPGMVPGSPGMPGPAGGYTVVGFDAAGRIAPFLAVAP